MDEKGISERWRLVYLGASLCAACYFMKSLLNMLEKMDPMYSEKKGTQAANDWLERKLRRPSVKTLKLTDYESMIAEEVLDPEDIEGGFDTIGGLEALKKEIFELAVLPLRRAEFFNQPGRLRAQPKGLLFYGPPGTGKTMLAKAIAKESGAAFINVRPSALMNKYFGESNKLVSSMFALARKLAPAIIFIDEVDGFLKARGGLDDTPWLSIKGEFLQLWDGVTSQDCLPVMVLGATNRPYDLDHAIQRRFARQFELPLPSLNDRVSILQKIMKDEPCDASVNFYELASKTEGYTGSDLKELCRAAAMLPVSELVQYNDNGTISVQDVDALNVEDCRPVSMRDFDAVFCKVKPTGAMAHEFEARQSPQQEPMLNSSGFLDPSMLQWMLQRVLSQWLHDHMNGAPQSSRVPADPPVD